MIPITVQLHDYILASGYRYRPQTFGYAMFHTNDCTIQFSMDTIEVSHRKPSDGDHGDMFTLTHRFTGTSSLNFTQWALLLDMMQAISIKDNMHQVREQARNEHVDNIFTPILQQFFKPSKTA
jgi:hypothetical protein